MKNTLGRAAIPVAALVLTVGSFPAGNASAASLRDRKPVFAAGARTPLGDELLRDRAVVSLETAHAGDHPAWQGRLVYFDVRQDPSPAQLAALGDALARGAWILLDGTASGPERQSSLSGRIGGLSFRSPVVLIRRGEERTHYVPLDLAPPTGPPTAAAGGAETAAVASRMSPRSYADPRLIAAIEEALTRPQPPGPALLSGDSGNPPYHPEYGFTVTAGINSPCWLPEKLEGDGLSGSYKDFCRGQARAEIVYHVDLIRSVPAGNGSDDAKYVRVWVSADRGGTGWHLANDTEQIHTWFQSWAFRDESFGPVADKYRFRVYSHDPSVQLVEHAPAQTNPTTRETRTWGFTVGVTGEVGAELNEDGPKIGGKVGGSFAYSNERSVSYDTEEYTLVNNAGFRPNGAEWIWDRKSSDRVCDWLTSQSAYYCTMVGVLWDSSWVVRKGAFGAISYNNFVPGFMAIFKVPGSRGGVSTFEVDSFADPMALYAKVIPSPLYWVGNIRWRATTGIGVGIAFDVNWDSPVFEPDAHVRLQALDSDLCLDVYGSWTSEGAPVIGWPCRTVNRSNQTWGFDGEERYRSRVAPNRCLTADADGYVRVRACDYSLSQKWYWVGDKLHSRAPVGRPLALTLNGGWAAVAAPESANTNWKPYYVLPEP